MALRGNLKDFSLPDVFQLVTFSKKTGVLRIRREDGAEGSVWFREGEVFFAQSNWHGEPLGERLVAASRITPAALGRALDIRRNEAEEGRRLGQILVDEGYITDKVLEAFVQEQIQDTIFDLMRWDEGDFDFELLPEVVDEDIGLSVSIENVVMEGSRRLEEWARIKKKVPSMEVVFKMATAPGEGTFEISLKPIEWELLLLVDGTRSVSELATETARTDFEVARIIYGLFSAGLLEFAADDEVVRLRAERAERDVKLEAYRAKQREADEAAAREAMAREAALVVEAEKRRAAEAEATAQVAAKEAAEEAARSFEGHENPEVPEFLAGQTEDASSDDMSVFAEMMDAVLEAPGEEKGTAPGAEPPIKRESSAPVEEPGFLTAQAQDISDADSGLPEDVMDLVGMMETPVEFEEAVDVGQPVSIEEPAGAEDATAAAINAETPTAGEAEEYLEPVIEAEDAPVVEAGYGIDAPPAAPVFEHSDVDETPAAAEEVTDRVAEPAEAEPADDLAADLMALGLGELPTEDLLAPIGTEPSVIGVAQPASESAPQDEEPGSGEDASPVGLENVISVDNVEGLSIAEIEAMAAEIPHDDVAAERDKLEIPVVDEAPDFSDLLMSLDESTQSADEPTTGAEDGLVDELDRDAQPSGGVISTDAFLADIAPDELGFSGGLSDELNALTGGGRARPSASVNRIPEAGSNLELHRDQTVDKELVLKIIEGLKDL